MTPQLILFEGITGSGKSTLLELLREAYKDTVKVGKKITTRSVRSTDNDWEFEFLNDIPAVYQKYRFNSVGNDYAVNEQELKDAIGNNAVYSITCSNPDIIAKLKTDFRTRVIYVYRPWTDSGFETLLRARNTTKPADIEKRKTEVKNTLADYCAHITLYDHVILNTGTTAELLTQLKEILHGYDIMPDEK